MGRAASTALVALLGIGASCSGSPVRDPSKFPHPTCDQFVPYDIDPMFDDDMHASIDKAAAAWTEATGHRHCFVRVADGQENEPGVLHFKARGTTQEMCEEAHSACDNHVVVGCWVAEKDTVYLLSFVADHRWALAAHEIGHVLRLGHEEKASTVMRAMLPNIPETITAIPEHDRREYCRLWGCSR